MKKLFSLFIVTLAFIPSAAFADMIPPFGVPISGTVWEDDNGNGLQESTEQNLNNITVNLYIAETETLVDSTITNEFGQYAFMEVAPSNDAGEYIVEFADIPGDYYFSPQMNNSHADPVTGMTDPFYFLPPFGVVRNAGIFIPDIVEMPECGFTEDGEPDYCDEEPMEEATTKEKILEWLETKVVIHEGYKE